MNSRSTDEVGIEEGEEEEEDVKGEKLHLIQEPLLQEITREEEEEGLYLSPLHPPCMLEGARTTENPNEGLVACRSVASENEDGSGNVHPVTQSVSEHRGSREAPQLLCESAATTTSGSFLPAPFEDDGTMQLLRVACKHPELRRCLESLESDWIPQFNRVVADFKLLPSQYRRNAIPEGPCPRELSRVLTHLAHDLSKAVIHLDCLDLDALDPSWGGRTVVRQARKELIQLLEVFNAHCDQLLSSDLPLRVDALPKQPPLPEGGRSTSTRPSNKFSTSTTTAHSPSREITSSSSSSHSRSPDIVAADCVRAPSYSNRPSNSFSPSYRSDPVSTEAFTSELPFKRSRFDIGPFRAHSSASSCSASSASAPGPGAATAPPAEAAAVAARTAAAAASGAAPLSASVSAATTNPTVPSTAGRGRGRGSMPFGLQQPVPSSASCSSQREREPEEKKRQHGEFYGSSDSDAEGPRRKRHKGKRHVVDWSVKVKDKIDQFKKVTSRNGTVTSIYDQPVSREALLTLLSKCENSLAAPHPEPTTARMAVETFIAGLECAWNYLQQLRINKAQLRILFESACVIEASTDPKDLITEIKSLQGLLKTFGMF